MNASTLSNTRSSLLEGGVVMGITSSLVGIIPFLILAFVVVFLIARNFLGDRERETESPEKPVAVPTVAVGTATVAEPSQTAIVANPIDDLELVAVITAALAASLNTKTDKLIVRSIKRSTKWNEAS